VLSHHFDSVGDGMKAEDLLILCKVNLAPLVV